MANEDPSPLLRVDANEIRSLRRQLGQNAAALQVLAGKQGEIQGGGHQEEEGEVAKGGTIQATMIEEILIRSAANSGRKVMP